jgi:hypothetical protein
MHCYFQCSILTGKVRVGKRLPAYVTSDSLELGGLVENR